jgi:hypothetical protein
LLIVIAAVVLLGGGAVLTLWLTGAFGGGSSTSTDKIDVKVTGGQSASATAPLEGLWSTEPNCSGTRITYSPGNRWRYDDGREGTYAFSGGNYTSYETGGPTTLMRVVRRDANVFETEDPRDGYRATRYRCTGAAASQPPSAGGNLSFALSTAAAQFRSRLPMRSGPTTITDVQASGTTLTMYVSINQPVAGAWSQLDAPLRSNICSGGFGQLIRQGASAVVQLRDLAGSQHSLTVNSC